MGPREILMSGILDQYGRPTSSAFFSGSRNGDGRAPAIPIRALDPLRKLLTYRDWKVMSYLSARLFAGNGIVKGTICQKSMYAIGNAWEPVFLGEDKEWGEETTAWATEQWFPTCDIKGPEFDFKTGLFLDSITTDRDGDGNVMLTRSENTGWPMLQRIPTRQIGQQNGWEERVVGGPYDGCIIRNGVILNRQERPIAFRVLGENPGEHKDIPAANMVRYFEPEWYEQYRGLPLVSASIDDFRNAAQSDEWEQQCMLIASAIGLVETNQSGADENDPAHALSGLATSSGDPIIKFLQGGMIRYIKAGSGNLQQFVNAKPGKDWEDFQDRIVRRALAGANWPYSMAWKPEGGNGTVQRADLNKAKSAVSDRQMLIFPRAKRMLGYAISVAMGDDLKALPKYKGKDKGGFLKWGFTMPALITIDEGRDKDQQREDLKLGITTMQQVCSERGMTWQHVRQQRETEVLDLITRAQNIAKLTGVSFEQALVMMQQSNANSTAPASTSGNTPTNQPQE